MQRLGEGVVANGFHGGDVEQGVQQHGKAAVDVWEATASSRGVANPFYILFVV